MARAYIRQENSEELIVTLMIYNASTGRPVTDLVYNTSNLQLYYKREGSAKQLITLVDATIGTWTSSGFKHDAYGSYELGLPNVAIDAGCEFLDIFGGKSDNADIVIVPVYVDLTGGDPRSALQAANVVQMNSAPVIGDGTEEDLWRGVE